MKTFSCSLCDYTTNRKYNLERHTHTVHFDDAPNINIDNPNVNIENPNVNIENPNVNIQSPNVNIENPNVNINDMDVKCNVCNKVFSSRCNMLKHQRLNRCRGECQQFECPKCNITYSCRQSKSRHMKTCNITQQAITTEPTIQQTTNNVNIGQQNNVNGNQINNTTYVLNFPNGIDDTQFSFVKDHITTGRFEKLIGDYSPAMGFSRYASALMERPENRVIHKTSPNTKHSKVNNNGTWEYVLDEDAFPVLTFHMSCAALEDTHSYKEKIKRPKIDIESLLRYLDDVNTENDENPNYKLAVERLKLNIINLSQRHKIPLYVDNHELNV